MMKKIVFLFTCLAMTFAAEAQMRIIHNNDGTDLLGNYWFNQRPLTVADVEAAVDMVSGSQVTTYMICTGSSVSMYRSKYTNILGQDWTDAPVAEKFKKDSAFYANTYYGNHLRLEAEGTDLIKTTLSRARKNGLETFITYRMNDLHFANKDACPLNSVTKFWYENPQFWTNDASIGYNSAGALDFAHEEVRERCFNLISEQLERYADYIDGYDLDFMRFFVYFKSDEARDNSDVMTEFVQRIRGKVDAVADSVGHKILLSARVAPTVEDNASKGLDVREWLRQGLLDFISIGTHWMGDPAMPAAKFRSDLGDDLNIPLYASIDDGGFAPREFWSHGAFRGMASSILGQGADGLYLFNYFFGAFNSSHGGKVVTEEGGQVCRVIDPQLLQELGSLETLRRRNKVYAVSDGNVQYGIRQTGPFPLMTGDGACAEIFVGDDLRRDRPKEMILFVRLKGNCSVRFNGHLLQEADPSCVALYDKARNLQQGDRVVPFKLSPRHCRKGYNEVEFGSVDGGGTIIRMELVVKYGEVQDCGYF